MFNGQVLREGAALTSVHGFYPGLFWDNTNRLLLAHLVPNKTWDFAHHGERRYLILDLLRAVVNPF